MAPRSVQQQRRLLDRCGDEPGGLERAQGLFSAHYQKDATDPRWRDDKGMQDNLAFMKKYLPNIDTADSGSYAGYNVAQTLAQVLRQCGDELTRENFMRQAADLRDLELPMLLPGIKVNTSPSNFFPVKRMQLVSSKATAECCSATCSAGHEIGGNQLLTSLGHDDAWS